MVALLREHLQELKTGVKTLLHKSDRVTDDILKKLIKN